MLSNAYFLAKFRFDTAENEPAKSLQNFANFELFFFQFLAGSFSAVSKRIFARKYAYDSMFQALQDLHTFAPLQSQNCQEKTSEIILQLLVRVVFATATLLHLLGKWYKLY